MGTRSWLRWLLATALILGCGDGGTGPTAQLDVQLEGVSAETEVLTVELTGLTFLYLRCHMQFRLVANGGKTNDAAVFESGLWRAGPGTANTGTIEVAWFTDIFGSDRVRSGEPRSAFIQYTRFSDVAYTFEMTLRFRMPDGALHPVSAGIPCNP